MSEDFGIGFAGVFVQDYLGFPIACHTSTYFFNRPPGTSISSKACPDFLFHRPGWPSRWITVEAKGTQTSVGQSNKQIASGKAKQIYPFLKDHPGYHGIVVGTFISREGYNSPSRIRVVDPSLKKRRKRVKEVDSLRVAKLHYYRIAAALSEVQVSSEDWQELGIQEMFQRSGLVEKRKIADATWWHRRIEVPNSPPLPWIDGGADVISIDIGMPSFLIDLIDQSKLPEEWDLAIERLDPRPIFDLYKDTKFTIPVWSRKYGDGVAVSVSVRGKKQTRVRSVS